MNKKDFWRTAIVDGKENPRYKVSRDGRIICLNWGRTGIPRMCSLIVNSWGYVVVYIDGVQKKVHRIVAETFIPNPQNKPQVDHINTNTLDNRVWNLRWTTAKENNNNSLTRKHMSENSAMRGKFSSEHHNAKPIVQLSLNGEFIKKWDCGMDIHRELGISIGNLSLVCNNNRRRRKTGGFRWMFYSDWLKTRRKKSLKDIKPLFV